MKYTLCITGNSKISERHAEFHFKVTTELKTVILPLLEEISFNPNQTQVAVRWDNVFKNKVTLIVSITSNDNELKIKDLLENAKGSMLNLLDSVDSIEENII